MKEKKERKGGGEGGEKEEGERILERVRALACFACILGE